MNYEVLLSPLSCLQENNMVTVTVKLTEEEVDAILMYVSKGVTSNRSKQLKNDFQKIKDMIEEAKEERIKGLYGEQCED
tara:strand:+ start:108 stop:344 length:237 start_codon:yes stop_codon:yes gene_type:complete